MTDPISPGQGSDTDAGTDVGSAVPSGVGGDGALRVRPLEVRYLQVGDARHGVTRFGIALARAVAVLGDVAVRIDRTTPGATTGETPHAVTHLQFTDNQWGEDAAAAARAFATTVRSVRGPVVVTVHDLPDPADDPARWSRRARAYADVARCASRVVVCSHHEADRLRLAAPDIDAMVIPNPMPVSDPMPVRSPLRPAGSILSGETGRTGPGRSGGSGGPVRGPTRAPTVGVLGWIFPGKGHGSVVDALAGRRDLHVVALGAIARGHQPQAADLAFRARRAGLAFSTTGWLDDDRQLVLVRSVDVPVAPHPRPSASGSMLAWIAAGRRPLVRRSPYAEELAARAPGAVSLYDSDGLAAAIERALDEPTTTWTGGGDGHHAELAPATAARRHLELYDGVQ